MKNPRVIRFIMIAVVALGGWIYKTKFAGGGSNSGAQVSSEQEKQGAGPKLKENWNDGSKSTSEKPTLKTDWNKSDKKPAATSSKQGITKVNGHDRMTGCQLVNHKNNDGDSFHIKHNGKDIEIRLYYVDTAEKYYSDRYENQRERVRDQGKDFGGLSVDQVIQLGNEAKDFSLELLKGKSFTVHTMWEEVYDSGRYYAFVEVPGTNGKYLNEILVASGLVRIHTKGVNKGQTTPDGRDHFQYRDHLIQTERAAKKAGVGAWGM